MCETFSVKTNMMEASHLSLLLLLNSLDSASSGVSLVVSPKRSQFFKHEGFSVHCEDDHDRDIAAGWTVMKMTQDGEVPLCPSSCLISPAYPVTDSGEYWCESSQGETSDSVNISVTAGHVILMSPPHPVTHGDKVTLHCRLKSTQASAFDGNVEFYKDGVLTGRSTGNMTLYGVSRSDEGLYSCKIFDFKSPESKLTVSAPPTGRNPSYPIFTLVRLLLVGFPYLLSTILLGLRCRDRRQALRADKKSQPSNAVIMEMCDLN